MREPRLPNTATVSRPRSLIGDDGVAPSRENAPVKFLDGRVQILRFSHFRQIRELL